MIERNMRVGIVKQQSSNTHLDGDWCSCRTSAVPLQPVLSRGREIIERNGGREGEETKGGRGNKERERERGRVGKREGKSEHP